VKLFVDENLSPALANVCHEAGYEATCSRDRGMLGRADHEVLAFAEAENAVIVTNDATDFRELCAAEEVHPGLIVLANTAREKSEQLLMSALRHIETRAAHEEVSPRDFMLNRAVEVELDGTCTDYEIPPSVEPTAGR
jgi:predicted nuclease of predicted toxin-antitoxin system